MRANSWRGATRKKRNDVKIIIMTRFSVYSHNIPLVRTFLPNVVDKDEYLEHMYSKKRLEDKFSAFERVTLPSILAQSYKNLEWYIYTSPTLPADYLERLNKLLSVDPRFHLKIVRDIEQARNYFAQRGLVLFTIHGSNLSRPKLNARNSIVTLSLSDYLAQTHI